MKRKLENIDEEENRLSNLLFNKPEQFAEKLKSGVKDEPLNLDLKPAWIDEDDDAFDAKMIPNTTHRGLYKDALKQKYETLIGTPNWARLDRAVNQENDDDQILRTVGHLKKTKSVTLPKDFLQAAKFPKINFDGDKKQTITCLKFHPTASVALVGTHLGAVGLFSIGGDVNNQLHSFQLKNFRATCAWFTPDGSEAYIASKSHHSYCVYNLIKAEPKYHQLPRTITKPTAFILSPCGKYLAVAAGFDEVFIISTASKELLKALKHNNDVESFVFSPETDKLYCYCKQGEVYIWSMSTYRVVKKFYDHGCVTASCIATSPCGRLLVTGSGEGIVNIYETSSLDAQDPMPVKTVENLKTKITNIQFNSTTEILSVSSAFYPNAVKFIHIPSYHVFSNFPQQGLNLGQVDTVSFSPNSGFVALGNNRGCTFLYRLKHYKNY